MSFYSKDTLHTRLAHQTSLCLLLLQIHTSRLFRYRLSVILCRLVVDPRWRANVPPLTPRWRTGNPFWPRHCSPSADCSPTAAAAPWRTGRRSSCYQPPSTSQTGRWTGRRPAAGPPWAAPCGAAGSCSTCCRWSSASPGRSSSTAPPPGPGSETGIGRAGTWRTRGRWSGRRWGRVVPRGWHSALGRRSELLRRPRGTTWRHLKGRRSARPWSCRT